MAAWEIKGLWTGKEIGEYRAYVAGQATARVGNQRCTCEDLSMRLVTDFAESRGLPVAFHNGTYPRKIFTGGGAGTGAGSRSQSNVLAFRNGLTPEDFASKGAFFDAALTSTGASDLLGYSTAKYVAGAVEGKVESLDLAKEGDLIILYSGGGHVQVVTSVGAGLVNIMQGNFRPKNERATTWDKVWGTNQNDPNDPKYIGAMVAKKSYTRDANNDWFYDGSATTFAKDLGRVMIWDFDAWNALIVKHEVAANETLSKIALDRWGDGTAPAWNRIYSTNKTKIGSDPNHLRSGLKLYVWK